MPEIADRAGKCAQSQAFFVDFPCIFINVSVPGTSKKCIVTGVKAVFEVNIYKLFVCLALFYVRIFL